MLNKKIILTFFVCGIAALQATAQTVNTAAKPAEQHDLTPGVIGKPRTNTVQVSEKTTQHPAISGNANRPAQPAPTNTNGKAAVVSTPGNPNGKVKTAPKN